MDGAEMLETGWVDHRGHRVWFGTAGRGPDPSAEAGTAAPLLLIHGGPGIPHDYLLPLTGLADERRVVLYDQYGCGLSDRAEDPDEYTIELFVEEIARVRSELGLERVHLLAHSYGGPLAIEYLLRNPGSGVASLVLSNSFASVPGLVNGWEQRLSELPPEEGEALRGGDTASAAYQAALGDFIGRFIFPGTPPDLLMVAQSKMGGEVYAAMHGSSWFTPNGRWAGWDAQDRLSELQLPVMAISGVRDQCVPALSQVVADSVPHGEVYVLEAAHLPMLELPTEYIALVRDFLVRAEKRPIP